MSKKTCTKCGESFPATLEYFGRQSKGKNGLDSRCKLCSAKQRKQWYADNREYNKQYYARNRESSLASSKQWRKDNPLLSKQYGKQWYIDNKELTAQRAKKWGEDNPDSRSVSKRKWIKNNHDKVNILTQGRRARKRELPSTLTTEQWETIKQYFNDKCAYCGESKPLTVEHFVPVSKLGELSTNNILPACSSCNSSKGAKDFRVWYPEFKHYSKLREQEILKYLNYKNETQQLTFAL